MRIKNLLKYLIALILVAECPMAFDDLMTRHYIGIDAQVRHMRFHEDFGGSTLKSFSSQGNVYFGLMLMENVGIEVGYEETENSSRIETLNAGQYGAGAMIQPAFSPAVIKSTIKIQGPHAGLVFFYPTSIHNLDIFFSAGLSFLKGASTRETMYVLGNVPRFVKRTMVARRKVPRLALGVQYEISDRTSIRGSVGWIGTRSLKIYENDGVYSMYRTEIRTKDSKFAGIGLLFKF